MTTLARPPEMFQRSQSAHVLGFRSSHLYLQRTACVCVCVHAYVRERKTDVARESFVYILTPLQTKYKQQRCLKLRILQQKLQQIHLPLSCVCRLVACQQPFTATYVLATSPPTSSPGAVYYFKACCASSFQSSFFPPTLTWQRNKPGM